MKPEAIKAALGDLPHMTLAQGTRLWEFLREHALRDCLELGFYHGVSSAYIAAALDEMGGGTLVSIDAAYALTLEPGFDDVLRRAGVSRYVSRHFEPTSYVWRLMKMLEEDPTPRFDFCYIDGAHTWDADGFAFLLVEKLLRPGGWVLLDDLDWTFDSSPTLRKTPRVQQLPDEERRTPQVRKVYELLVKTHPHFDQFREEGDWAFARKSTAAPGAPETPRREVIVETKRLPSLAGVYAGVSARVRKAISR